MPGKIFKRLMEFRSEVNKKSSDVTTGVALLDSILKTNGATLKFVARGAFGNVFYLDKPVPMAVKFAPGSKTSKSYKANRQAEVAKYLEYLLENDITEHITAISTAFWIKTVDLPDEVIAFPKKPDREPMDNTLVIFTEWANSGDFLELFRKKKLSSAEIKIIIFQVLFALAKIQFHYPNFKHNDLKPNNILLVKEEEKGIKKYVFNDSTKFDVPAIEWSVRINDFDLSTVKAKHKNHYSDLHFFLATTKKFMKEKIPKRIDKFINSVLDTEGPFKESNPCRYIGDKEHTTPISLLKEHPFFKNLRS